MALYKKQFYVFSEAIVIIKLFASIWEKGAAVKQVRTLWLNVSELCSNLYMFLKSEHFMYGGKKRQQNVKTFQYISLSKSISHTVACLPARPAQELPHSCAEPCQSQGNSSTETTFQKSFTMVIRKWDVLNDSCSNSLTGCREV